MNPSLGFIVRVGSGAPDAAPAFLGSGFLVAPDRVLTCRHVVQEQTPYGQPTDAVRNALAVQSGDGPWVAVVDTAVAEATDLALLTLGTAVAVPTIPPFLWGLSQALSERLRAAPLVVIGYAQRAAQGPLWQHPLQDLWLLPSVREDSGLLSEVQLHGGIPAGCSGSPVLLPLDEHWAYAGIVYLGGERSATSRLILADPVVEFLHQCGLHSVARLDAVRALAGPAAVALIERPAASERLPNPYRGLSAFREADAPYFFGREDDAQALFETVTQQPFVALVGASGSGKSSLLFAGLAPRLRQAGDWQLASFRPGRDPFDGVATALAPLIYPELDKLERRERRNQLLRALGDGRLSLADSVAIWAEEHPEQRLLLIADQFEELYTQNLPEERQQRFLAGLMTVIQGDLPSSLLISLRADFLSQALAYGPLAEALDRYPKKILGPMNEDALRAAIEVPAGQLGVTLEPGLTERILKDLGEAPGALPLLEFALTELWQRQKSGSLSHGGYDAIGGVSQALAHYADSVTAPLRGREAQLRRVFVQLVRPGEGTEDTRQVATREQVGEAHWPLVKELADKRLVVTGAHEEDEQTVETVEVVHEALIRHWQPLREWINEDRAFRTWQNRLRQALRDWEDSGRDGGALLRGARLAEAEEQLQQHRNELSGEERGYVETSMAVRNREAVVRSLWRWGMTIGALVVALVMSGLAGYGYRQQQRAEGQRVAALKAKTEAEVSEKEAVEARLEAEKQHNLAISRQLATQATMALTNKPMDLVKAALLATESLKWAQTVEGYSVWERTMSLLPRRIRHLKHEGDVDDLAFSPDGQRLVTIPRIGRTARAAGSAAVWDAVTGAKLAIAPHQGWVNDIAFSPDGKLLASASWDRTVAIVDVAAGVERYRLKHEGPVWSLAFNPSDPGGKYLATGSADGTIRIWNLELTKEMYRVQHQDGVGSLVFSPDGKYFATASHDHTARIWKSDTGEELKRLQHPSPVSTLVFTPDGQVLGTISGDDNVARLWDTATGEEKLQLAHDDGINDISFSLDGSRVLTASQDGTVRLWDSVTGKELDRFSREMPEHEFDRFLGYGSVWKATENPNGTSIAIVPAAKEAAVIWDTKTASASFRGTHDDRIYEATFSPDGNYLATGGKDGKVKLWNTTTGENTADLKYDGTVDKVVFSPDGKYLAASARLSEYSHGWGEAIIWDVESGEENLRFGGHPSWMTDVSYAMDGRLVATSSWDSTARIWDAQSGTERARLKHEAPVFSLSFNLDGSRLITESSRDRVRVWDLNAARQLAELGDPGGVEGVRLVQDRRRLVTTGNDDTLRIWDAQTGSEMHRIPGGGTLLPDGKAFATLEEGSRTIQIKELDSDAVLKSLSVGAKVSHYAISPSGENLAAKIRLDSGVDEIQIWDISLGKMIAHFSHPWQKPPGKKFLILSWNDPNHQPINDFRFSPDGKFLATAGIADASACIWDPETGRLIGKIKPNVAGGFPRIIFSDDSRRIVIVNAVRNVLGVWDLLTGEQISEIRWNEDRNFGARPVFSPESSRLAFGVGGDVQVWDIESEKLQLEFTYSETKAVNTLTFSPDGTRLAVGGRDAAVGVVIWDLKKGKEHLRFSPNADLRMVAFAADGDRLITWDWTGSARAWDPGTGKELFHFSHSRTVDGIAYSHRSNRATTRIGALAQIWDSNEGRKIAEFSHEGDVQRMALSLDGSQLVTVASDDESLFFSSKYAHVWDTSTKEERFRLTHDDNIEDVSFIPGNRKIVTASRDHTVRIWDSATGEELIRLDHDNAVYQVVPSPDGACLAVATGPRTASSANEIQVWDLARRQVAARVPLYGNRPREVAFSDDSHWIAIADSSPTVRMVNPETARPEKLLIRHSDWPSSVALSPDGKHLATVEHTQLETHGSSEESFERFRQIWKGTYEDKKEGEGPSDAKHRIWDLATGKALTTIPHTGGVYQIAFNPDGTRVLTGGADHTARLWDAATGKQLDQLDHEDSVNGVTFSPDGFLAATRTTAGDAHLWDLRSKRSMRVAEDGYVNRLAFSPDSKSLATAEGDTAAEKDGRSSAVVFGSGTQSDAPTEGDVATEDGVDTGVSKQPAKKTLGVRLWDVGTGEQMHYLSHPYPVDHVLFSPDGTQLATDMPLKRTDAVQLWNTKTGERIANLQASSRGEGIDVKAFSSDGKYLAANTYKEVLIWEVAKGREVIRLLHDEGVGDIAFAGGDQYVAVANGDKISIWDWMNNRQIAKLSHDELVTDIAFTPDDSRLVTASQDDMVRLWAWRKDDLIADACSRLEHNFTPDEWRNYLRDEPYRETCPGLPVPDR